jgi:adenylate cyclase
VDMLSQDGARVIGFDIGFLEPDENSQLTFIQHFSEQVTALGTTNPALADFINESKTHADNDLALAHAIKNSSATVVLGYFFHMSAADLDARLAQQDIDQQLQRISASKYPFISYKGPGTDVVPFLKAYAPESNLEILTEAAAASGYFSLQSDQDGVVRWMPLMIQGGEELLLNYPGPPKTFPYFSISDILSGKLARGTFTDKIVLFGATATGTYDMRSTPFSTVYPGAEIHATIIDNILTQRFITKPRWSEIYDLLAIIILGVLIGITLPRLGAVKGLLCTTGLFILHIFIARWLFVHFGVR